MTISLDSSVGQKCRDMIVGCIELCPSDVGYVLCQVHNYGLLRFVTARVGLYGANPSCLAA